MAGAYRGSAAGQDEPKIYPAGGGVRPPKLVFEVKPRDTEAAMDEKIAGRVGLDAVVLGSGVVGEVRVLESLDAVHGLDDEAVQALKQGRYRAGTKDGKPVAVRIDVE